MNYPKKEEYQAIKRLSKKERNTIGKLEEFLDFRSKHNPPNFLKYGDFFIPIFNFYNIINLRKYTYNYQILYFSEFIKRQRTEILKLKELLNIKDFYSYRYPDRFGSCTDDLAGILFNDKKEKMIFLLKHMDIIDTILK